MTTLDDHDQEKREAQSLVGQCPKCKEWPVIRYEPGCTFANCKCRKFAVPDEDRKGLARIINEHFEPRLKR